MKIPRDGREYAKWSLSGGPEGGAYEVKFDYPDNTESAWIAVETVSQSLVRILVRGPDAASGAGAVVLPLGNTSARLRLTDSPEIILRPAGEIEVS
jgi:hypothetical protein